MRILANQKSNIEYFDTEKYCCEHDHEGAHEIWELHTIISFLLEVDHSKVWLRYNLFLCITT
jgi:hypothetical protein